MLAIIIDMFDTKFSHRKYVKFDGFIMKYSCISGMNEVENGIALIHVTL